MRILLLIISVVIYSFGICQDKYPFFNDLNKQMDFEEMKIYIIEKSEKEQHFIGGDSYTELANTFGHLFLEEDPSYVVKQTPKKIYYKYYYEFKIMQGRRELTELEFFLIAGYDQKAKEIFQDFDNKISDYNSEYRIYENELTSFKDYNVNNDSSITSSKNKETSKFLFGIGNTCYYLWLGLGGYALMTDDYSDGVYNLWINTGIVMLGAYGLGLIIPQNDEPTSVTFAIPQPPAEPILEQTLSNEQLISLAEAYNRKIFQEIQLSN